MGASALIQQSVVVISWFFSELRMRVSAVMEHSEHVTTVSATNWDRIGYSKCSNPFYPFHYPYRNKAPFLLTLFPPLTAPTSQPQQSQAKERLFLTMFKFSLFSDRGHDYLPLTHHSKRRSVFFWLPIGLLALLILNMLALWQMRIPLGPLDKYQNMCVKAL